MKTLLIILGIIAIAGGAFGYITMNNAGVAAGVFDFASDLAGQLGLTSSLTFEQQARLFLVDNRTILVIAGAVLLLVGLAVRKRA